MKRPHGFFFFSQTQKKSVAPSSTLQNWLCLSDSCQKVANSPFVKPRHLHSNQRCKYDQTFKVLLCTIRTHSSMLLPTGSSFTIIERTIPLRSMMNVPRIATPLDSKSLHHLILYARQIEWFISAANVYPISPIPPSSGSVLSHALWNGIN